MLGTVGIKWKLLRCVQSPKTNANWAPIMY